MTLALKCKTEPWVTETDEALHYKLDVQAMKSSNQIVEEQEIHPQLLPNYQNNTMAHSIGEGT